MIDEQTTTDRVRKSSRSFWKELPVLLVVALVVALLVRTFVVQTFYIPSPSMEHTLDIDDRVLVNKLVYDFRDPRGGEIIVFVSPMSWRTNPSEEDFIKRVIGVPGDHVVCCDQQGRIQVNGRSLDEPYIRPNTDHTGQQAAPETFDIVVPAGRLWVMGDNRYESADSLQNWRSHNDLQQATIPIDAVVGRAFVLFWPFGRATWLSVPATFDSVPGS
ncbi:MAG: signal peptidase I [Hamadaea sp.]|uniref:signal peptidase I n=1 Tax=Hamadaea sp. TaxID=2024425 RepID=UPI00182B8A4B|nr:signal peptidase I [Hamadaea sp.]NUR69250.1 signal peptidase I [Hamadaea sp.]NUT21112.1 signal peptidase I [Hamadaea sp.]